MSLKMYVWHVHPSFLAVAQANSVEEARSAVLRSDLGESGDGSCPERDNARKFVLSNTPAVWYGVNAEFVLTDSAELREQEDYSRKLFERVSELEADLAAAREDVARMDWLEELHPHDGLFGQSLQARELVHRSDGWSCGNNLLGGWFGGSTPRAAIAAARAGGGK